MKTARRVWVGFGIAALLGMLSPPAAQARVGLAPGTELHINGSMCSLGFIATNNDGDRLAVTAGHCATGTGQRVISAKGNPIGTVVSHLGDDMDSRVYGVALIQLSDNTYTADAYFTKFGNPGVGDFVKKYGARTEKTTGTVSAISVNAENPRVGVMYSTMVGLPGDSGSAWVGNGEDGPKLLGLNIGHTVRADGGYGEAIGFPIRSLIRLVQNGSDIWGPGFIPVGR